MALRGIGSPAASIRITTGNVVQPLLVFKLFLKGIFLHRHPFNILQ